MTKQQKIDQLIQMFAEMRRSMRKGIVNTCPDISKVQIEVLWEMTRGINRVGDIATELQVTPSAATQLVNQLVMAGYVSRSASETDRRETVLRITDKGQTMINELHTLMRERARDIAAILTDEELNTYIAISHKIAQYQRTNTEK